jgi:hypothetical protein
MVGVIASIFGSQLGGQQQQQKQQQQGKTQVGQREIWGWEGAAAPTQGIGEDSAGQRSVGFRPPLAPLNRQGVQVSAAASAVGVAAAAGAEEEEGGLSANRVEGQKGKLGLGGYGKAPAQSPAITAGGGLGFSSMRGPGSFQVPQNPLPPAAAGGAGSGGGRGLGGGRLFSHAAAATYDDDIGAELEALDALG